MERVKKLLAVIRERDETIAFLKASNTGPNVELDDFDAKLLTTVMNKFGAEPLEKILARFTAARTVKQYGEGEETTVVVERIRRAILN